MLGVFYCTAVKKGFVKLSAETFELLKERNVNSVLAAVVYSYLCGLAEYGKSNAGYFRLKDLEGFTKKSQRGIVKALDQLRESGLIKTHTAGFGKGRQTHFEIITEQSITAQSATEQSAIKQQNKRNKVQLLNGTKCSYLTEQSAETTIDIFTIDIDTIDSKTMSELSDESRTDARNTNEVQTSKDAEQTDLTPKAPNSEKKKVARKKKDHPETDRLLDKLMTLFDQWNLPRKPKRDREAMRKLLTGKSPAKPKTVNQLIDYLNWRGYDKELKQDLDGRHPNEIRAVSSFVSKFDKLHAEMEHARKLHSRKAQGNADRDRQIKEFVARQDYLYSEEGQAAVQQWRDEFADM